MKDIARFGLILFALLVLGLNGCAAPAGALRLEQHRLVTAPAPETLHFQPVQGSQEEVLAAHAGERAEGYSSPVITLDGNPAISSLGESGELVAVLYTSAVESQQTVRVLRGDDLIFETSAGLPSPVLPLQGLWTYGGHWALEILFAGQGAWAGQIFIDGVLVNGQKGYDEAFGFQLLAGKPFFFYSYDGSVGYSYDGQETDLGYDEIPHYRCCGESSLNPVPARTMVAFFTRQDDVWFYVELGDFDK